MTSTAIGTPTPRYTPMDGLLVATEHVSSSQAGILYGPDSVPAACLGSKDDPHG